MVKSATGVMLEHRAAGILCHLSSLPGPHCNGDLTLASCQHFIDWLVSAGQSYWQVLPLNPIGSGNSPYSSVCSFAGDPIYISLIDLVGDGLLQPSDLRQFPNPKSETSVNFDKARKIRLKLLYSAFGKFKQSKHYRHFVAEQSEWLEDYALFSALIVEKGTSQWQSWEKPLRERDLSTLQKTRVRLSKEIDFYKFLQFKFFEQWKRVKSYANQRKINIIGDIPIFVSHESSDVWGSQSNFQLAVNGSPKVVAGVPPDYFNAEGQLWGNALFDWQYMKRDHFAWWMRRLRHMASMFDLVRLDHFIGFYRYWAIPAGSKTAKKGTWKPAEGDSLLQKYQQEFGKLPFIAEDLGLVTKEVTALRLKYKLPAMKVIQLAFGNDASAPGHFPHNFDSSHCVVYTGTHDNNTTAGWYEQARQDRKNPQASFDFKVMKAYSSHCDEPHWSFCIDAYKSIAKLAIIPLQDVLGMGSSARMNVPGTIGKNWIWRVEKKSLKKSAAKELAAIAKATGRV